MLLDFPIIIADESVDFRIVEHLVISGFRVYSIIKETPGISDKSVIDIASEMNGYIITEDKDFGDELVYKQNSNTGVMLLRILDLPIGAKKKLILDALIDYNTLLRNSFAELNSKKLRIRKYI